MNGLETGKTGGESNPLPGVFVRHILRADAEEPVYRWVFQPMLLAQFVFYLVALGRFARASDYGPLAGSADPLLHENHLGNIAIMDAQPHVVLLSIHIGMAAFWVASVLVQKGIVRVMARLLE